MKDNISISRLELLHPQVRYAFKTFIEECEKTFNITLRIVQGLRTIEEQNELYAQGRTKPGNIVTNAKGGSSFHNYGLAIDVVEIVNSKADWKCNYERLVPINKKYGLDWGGDFKSIVDKPHFQKDCGFTIKQLLDKYNKKDFIQGTKYVSIV